MSVKDCEAHHSIPVSVFLHLLPGTACLVAHVLIVGWIVSVGWPVSFSWSVVINLLVFYPILFGILIYVARRKGNQGFALKGVVLYEQTLPIRRVLFWALIILLLTGPLWMLLAPVGSYLEQFFPWIPATSEAYGDGFPMYVIVITFALNFLFTGFVSPFAEELYYRGYLLPRMPKQFGRAAPLVHSFLFAVHHVHSPWLIITRTIGLLPLIYVTRYTRSVIPAILAHQFVNSYSLIEWATFSFR